MSEKFKLLIIEDNQDIRESTAEILDLAGYQVITAPEGKTGVEMAIQHLPSLILCDIMMPQLDGYGVLYMLHKNPKTANIPFIFLTAKAERADLRKAMEMGADDYLTKPFDELELLNAIESRLKKHRNREIEAQQQAQSIVEMQQRAQNQAQLAQLTAKSAMHAVNPDPLIKELISSARIKVFRKKQLIYQETDSPLYLYYLVKGNVRSFLYYKDGRELSTGLFSANSFFGYESLLLQEQYKDNVESLDEVEVALINKDKFFEVLYSHPAVASQFIKLLSGDVRQKEGQLLGFAYDTVRKRVANALVHVAEKIMVNDAVKDDSPKIRISRDDLAALAGTANETISRVLSDFKDEQLITKEGNAIRILSVERLKTIKQ